MKIYLLYLFLELAVFGMLLHIFKNKIITITRLLHRNLTWTSGIHIFISLPGDVSVWKKNDRLITISPKEIKWNGLSYWTLKNRNGIFTFNLVFHIVLCRSDCEIKI